MGVWCHGLAVVLLLWMALTSGLWNCVSGLSRQEKGLYREKVREMFFHAYNSYMTHAYPADELMPLTCKGRVRGLDRGRGDIDEALGKFSLTLIDSLDTLAVIGEVDEFNAAIRVVIRDVSFDNDVIVSVFETNIRVLGGLLGAHFAAIALKSRGYDQLSWYHDELLTKAEEVGRRLLPAFDTTTGLPYPKVNLRHGISFAIQDKTTCTACAGTILLEFAALSRLTGKPEFEMKAHRAMEAIWNRRDHGHNLVGTTINIHNGEWTRRDSGVGAGIDSYYEYCLKSYILLGDREYLRRFDKHYDAVMKYISNGPMLVDVSMNSPNRMTRSFMDSLLAFWPGLQVLWGDVDAAIHTHDMLYHVTERHNFLPEAFTLDFKVHWGNHPLRPEFVESTYFLYRATGDPYYLDIGKSVVNNLNDYARVSCGFAAIKDVKTNDHEDRMDSFVLAETFKYLFLLFAEEEDLVLDMNDFVFSTEAHIFPLSLATLNMTFGPRTALLVNNSRDATSDSSDHSLPTTSQPYASPAAEANQQQQPPVPSLTESFVIAAPLQCSRDYRPFILRDQYEKLMLKQCTSSRFRIVSKKKKKRLTPPRLNINTLDLSNPEHLAILKELGIVVESMPGGKIQVSHFMQKAKTPEDAEEGWYLMQDIMKAMNSQNAGGSPKRSAKLVQVLYPFVDEAVGKFEVGPALFGPDLGENEFQVTAQLTETEPLNGCGAFPNEDLIKGKIVLVTRGGCLFLVKVQNAEKGGAAGVIVADNVDYNATNGSKPPLPFSMSGDSDANVRIPSVFMQRQDAETLRELLREEEKVQVLLTWIPRYPDEEATTGNSSHDGEEESGHIGQSDNSQTESEVYKDKACAGEGRGTEQDARQCDSDQEHSSVGSNSLFDSGYSEPELESERENT